MVISKLGEFGMKNLWVQVIYCRSLGIPQANCRWTYYCHCGNRWYDITSKQLADVKRFKAELCCYWGISDKGELSCFLGFQVKCDQTACTISINQQAYWGDAKSIQAYQHKTGLNTNWSWCTVYKRTGTIDTDPGELNVRSALLWSNWLHSVTSYNIMSRCCVCNWNPLTIYSKPGIGPLGSTKTSHCLSWFHRVFMAYLWQKMRKFSERVLWCILGNPGTSALNLRYSYHLGQGEVSWSSKKQWIIALSTVEAEYMAQVHARKEALWLCTFVSKIQGEPEPQITIYSDNQGAIALLKDNKFNARTKHRYSSSLYLWGDWRPKGFYCICPNRQESGRYFHEAIGEGQVSSIHWDVGLWWDEVKDRGRPGWNDNWYISCDTWCSMNKFWLLVSLVV